MAKPTKPKARTIAFYRVMVEDDNGIRTAPNLTADDWQQALTNLSGKPIDERVREIEGERLIGRSLLVEDEYALRLMTPRGEDSWLAILKYKAKANEAETEDFLAAEDRDLVETSIMAFVPGLNNVFGLVRGSVSAPTHPSMASWLTDMLSPGKNLRFVAEPCPSTEVQKKLRTSGGVASTTVRVKTNAATEMNQKGMESIGRFLRRIEKTYGEMVVTMTFTVPPGTSQGHKIARDQLKNDTETLSTILSVEGLRANLVVQDETSRRREEVNFIEQRITAKALIPTHDDQGNVIREDSAVRQIWSKGTEGAVYTELQAADPE